MEQTSHPVRVWLVASKTNIATSLTVRARVILTRDSDGQIITALTLHLQICVSDAYRDPECDSCPAGSQLSLNAATAATLAQ